MEKSVDLVMNAVENYKQGLITKEQLRITLELLYEVGYGKGYTLGYNECENVYTAKGDNNG